MITNASSVSDLEMTSNDSEVTIIIADMLESQDCEEEISQPNDLVQEKQKDQTVLEIIHFLKNGKLSCDVNRAKKVALQGNNFIIIDDILYYVDSKDGGRRQTVVPKQFQRQILEESHSGTMAGHFAVSRLYAALRTSFLVVGRMYTDVFQYCRNCPQCTISGGGNRKSKPPLHPISVQRAFQIIGVDVLELPKTECGNQYAIVFQDFLTKWSMVFATPDQRAIRIARLLAEEIVLIFGVPECLLSNSSTNLLSHLMKDICDFLGIKKLNTTGYHPQCDRMVEKFNQTLISMLQKHADKYGEQWDKHLPGVLWAYRNIPHESTKEKPSFLLFGFDCRSPTEAAMCPPSPMAAADITDYCKELTESLVHARELAAKVIQKAQKQYNKQYDKTATSTSYNIGDLVLVYFPQEKTGS